MPHSELRIALNTLLRVFRYLSGVYGVAIQQWEQKKVTNKPNMAAKSRNNSHTHPTCQPGGPKFALSRDESSNISS